MLSGRRLPPSVLVVVAIAATASAAHADVALVFRTTEPASGQSASTRAWASDVAFKTETRAGYVLLRADRGAVYFVDPRGERYAERVIPDAAAPSPEPPGRAVATGERAEVARVACRVVEVAGTRVCAARAADLGLERLVAAAGEAVLDALPWRSAASLAELRRALAASEPLVPIRESAGGRLHVLVRASRESDHPARFFLPPGYALVERAALGSTFDDPLGPRPEDAGPVPPDVRRRLNPPEPPPSPPR